MHYLAALFLCDHDRPAQSPPFGIVDLHQPGTAKACVPQSIHNVRSVVAKDQNFPFATNHVAMVFGLQKMPKFAVDQFRPLYGRRNIREGNGKHKQASGAQDASHLCKPLKVVCNVFEYFGRGADVETLIRISKPMNILALDTALNAAGQNLVKVL